MGYFNYFIKCIIRNISYKLCKPKVFITVLLSIFILFGLKHYGFCALSDLDYEMIADGFSTITSNQGILISQLSSIGVDVKDLENSLSQIRSALSSIQSNQATIATQLNNIYNKIDTLNTNILNIYNRLDSNQKELLTELEKDNQAVLEELQMIRDALNGSDVENSSYSQSTINSSNSTPVEKLKVITIDYEKGYSYTIKLTYRNPYRWQYECKLTCF